MDQTSISATYMRGGTSKGVFLRADALPADPALRDRILLRILGSPDPYGQQMDGMGGATSSTSKAMVIARSSSPEHDIDYWFGQVAIDRPVVDWSGNCGNLTSAVGPFAIAQGLVDAPENGFAAIRMRHAGMNVTILSHVPMKDGAVVEDGDFELDGVTFPAAEIVVEFLEPGRGESSHDGLFPTGSLIDVVDIPGIGKIEMTMMNAGNPTVFVEAGSLGLRGNEMLPEINSDTSILKELETVRAHAAVCMGLAATHAEASQVRLHTPKLAFVARPVSYVASNGKLIASTSVDLNARITSMGKLHHAMTGTGAIALSVAAAIPGTLVQRILGAPMTRIGFGHPSGTMSVGAEVQSDNGHWKVNKAVMSRSARRLMEGVVFVPSRLFEETL